MTPCPQRARCLKGAVLCCTAMQGPWGLCNVPAVLALLLWEAQPPRNGGGALRTCSDQQWLVSPVTSTLAGPHMAPTSSLAPQAACPLLPACHATALGVRLSSASGLLGPGKHKWS